MGLPESERLNLCEDRHDDDGDDVGGGEDDEP